MLDFDQDAAQLYADYVRSYCSILAGQAFDCYAELCPWDPVDYRKSVSIVAMYKADPRWQAFVGGDDYADAFVVDKTDLEGLTDLRIPSAEVAECVPAVAIVFAIPLLADLESAATRSLINHEVAHVLAMDSALCAFGGVTDREIHAPRSYWAKVYRMLERHAFWNQMRAAR